MPDGVGVFVVIDAPTRQAIGPSIESVLEMFYDDAADNISAHIHAIMGTSSIYSLSPDYVRWKLTSGQMKRYPGKDPGQPLILSGDLYEAINVFVDAGGIVVNINDTNTVSSSGIRAFHTKRGLRTFTTAKQRASYKASAAKTPERYGAIWEHRTHFISKGIDQSIKDLTGLLEYRLTSALQITAGITPTAIPPTIVQGNASGLPGIPPHIKDIMPKPDF